VLQSFPLPTHSNFGSYWGPEIIYLVVFADKLPALPIIKHLRDPAIFEIGTDNGSCATRGIEKGVEELRMHLQHNRMDVQI